MIQEEESPKKENEDQRVINNYDWIILPDKKSNSHGLVISNMLVAEDHTQLVALNIKGIVTVMGEAVIKVDPTIEHFRVIIQDDPKENIKCFFETAIRFINDHKKNGNVLVHCRAGVSRSATIVIAYLMKTNGLSYNEALKKITEIRFIVEPNKGFTKQLKAYDRELQEQRKSSCQIY